MPSMKQYEAVQERLGFTPDPRRGFAGSSRIHPDTGEEQRLDVFHWANKKHAAAKGIPRSYLVFEVSTLGINDRRLVVLVDWPSEEQPLRPWKDVADEIVASFGPIFETTDPEEARALLDNLQDFF